jgi:hypothetical protein
MKKPKAKNSRHSLFKCDPVYASRVGWFQSCFPEALTVRISLIIDSPLRKKAYKIPACSSMMLSTA